MKYGLIILLACTPILALTGWSFFELASGGDGDVGNSIAVKPLDVSAAEKQSQELRAAAESLQPLAASLVESDLLDTRRVALPSVAGGPAALPDVWSRAEQARELVVQYRPLGQAIDTYLQSRQAPGPEDQQRANDTLKTLREFCDKATRAKGLADGLVGARPFLDQLQTYQASLDRDSQAYVLKKALDAGLAAADRALKVGSYKECYDSLPGCRLALSKYLAALEANAHTAVTAPQAKAQVEGQIDAMERRAEFGVQRGLLKPARAGSANEDQLTQYKEFLRRFTKPPTEAEDKTYRDVVQELDKLTVILAVEKLANHRTLRPLLEGASLIIETAGAQTEDKRLARAAVADWLSKTGVPLKASPDELRGLQEVTLQSGLRRIGIFFLPPGAEQYRYWSDVKKGAARSPAVGEDQISKSNVVQGPGKLQYVQWVDEYNEAVGKLFTGGSKQQWSSFRELCLQLQGKLDEYRNRPGIGVTQEPDRSFKELEFKKPAEVAGELLTDWELFQRVMAR